MSPPKNDVPKQFSNLPGLGAPVEIFKAKASLTFQIIGTIVLLIAAGGTLAYSGYLAVDMIRSSYYGPVIFETVLPWLVASAAAFLLALLVIWGIYSSRKKGAVVFENGFSYSDRKGVKAWKWDQVDQVTANIVQNYTNGIYTGTTHTYTLLNTIGEKLVINDSLENIENFYTHLQNKSLQLRYQRLADEYNQGKKVDFGPVSISKMGGLTIGKKSFVWDTIEQVSINKGVLSVKKKDGGWFSGATATSGSIPNLHVLLSIIDQTIGIKTG